MGLWNVFLFYHGLCHSFMLLRRINSFSATEEVAKPPPQTHINLPLQKHRPQAYKLKHNYGFQLPMASWVEEAPESWSAWVHGRSSFKCQRVFLHKETQFVVEWMVRHRSCASLPAPLFFCGG